MQNTKETIRALIRAFNVNNYDFNAVETNFGLQSGKKKDYIIVSFDKDMNEYQCREYLDKIKRKIISEFYDTEKYIGEELNTAKLIFDVKSFPFDISKGTWSKEQDKIKLVVPIGEGVIFNLKSHLAASLAKDVLEDMPTCDMFIEAPNKKDRLWHGKFPSARLSKQFRSIFLSRMKERYENVPDEDKFLEVEGNDVYIRDVFDNACFIDSIARYTACAIGIDLGTDNNVDYRVRLLKDSIIKSVYQSTKVMIAGFMCASPFGRKEASILIPVVQGYDGHRLLTKQEARDINSAFRGVVLNDLYGRTQAELSIHGNSGIYSIDFSNPRISHCVINKVIENSVINNDCRLTVDFKLPFQSWSRSPSTELDSPRHEQGLLHHTIDSSQSQQSIGAAAVGAGASVQEADIWLQQKNPWLSQGTHEDKWLQSLQPGPSGLSQQRPSLWPQGGHSSRTSAWPQPMDPWSSPAPSGDIPGLWPSAQVDSRDKPLTEKEGLIKALLNVFNLNNRSCDIVNTNFTLKNGEIVSLLGGYVNRKEYLQKVRNCIIDSHGYTEEEAKKIYNLDEFPFSFSPDSDLEEDERTTVLARNTSGAAFNLKTYLIQEFKEDIEEEVIEEQLVEKMKIKEEKARELIRRSVHLEKTNGSTSYLCSISFSNKCFQDQSRFERFKDTYIKEFELRLEKYGWNYSFKHNILYIESAINIDVIKKIEKHIKNEALIRYFIDEDEMEDVPIVFEDGCFQLDISCSSCEELTPQRPKFTGGKLKTGKVKQETNDSGFSEGQTEDEKAMSKPSEKQGKSNAVGADESSRSGKFSKAKSEEDRVSSKSGSESPKKHGGGRFCKERSKSNSSSGSNTSSEPLEPSVPNTEDRSTIQKMLSFSPPLPPLPPLPFKRNSNKQGRESKVSSISTPEASVSEKTPDPKQHNTFPTRKGNLSSVPSPMRLKEGCPLEFSYLEHKLADGSTCIGIMEGDAVEGKRRILYDFIYHLPYSINKKTEREKVLESLSRPLYSHEEIEDLYLKFSSPDKREELCLNFCDGNKGKWESLWGQIHQSYGKGLFMLKIPEKLEQSSGLVRNKPGCRASIASKGSEASKDSAYFTGSPASQRSSTSNIFGSSHEDKPLRSFSSCTSFLSEPSTSGSVLHDTLGYNPDSSDEDEFSDKSLRYGSSVSGSSTSGSVLHGTSKCSSNSSDEDEFFRHPVERALSRINKSPTDSSISSNTSSKTVIKHDTENKGANSPSSQMDLIRLVSTKPKDKEQIDRILGFR